MDTATPRFMRLAESVMVLQFSACCSMVLILMRETIKEVLHFTFSAMAMPATAMDAILVRLYYLLFVVVVVVGGGGDGVRLLSTTT